MASVNVEMDPTSPHVVMFGGTMVSHCVPCLLLARKLCALGINITFINTDLVISKLKAIDTGGDENGRLRMVALSNGVGHHPSDSYLVILEKSEERTFKSFDEYVKGLMECSEGWAPPCCAVIDVFVAWAIKITAPLMCSYIMWPSTAASVSLVFSAPVLQAQGVIPIQDFSEAEKLKPVELPCLPPLHPLEFLSSMQCYGPKFDVVQEGSRYILQVASGLLVNSVYELEPTVFDALNEHYHVGAPSSKLQSIIPVGPLLPASVFTQEEPKANSAGVGKEDPVLAWLDRQPLASVLYVAFGTIAELSASQVIELGLGLEASEQRFIWVLRPSSEVALDNLLPGFVERTKDQGVIVTGWASQVQILQHPATGGFLTHCGWSSIVESISGNVPMLAWPIQAEQMLNSRWLVDAAGAALKVRNGFETFASREQVENAVRLLMSEDEGKVLRKNVMRLNEVLIQKGAAESGSSSRNIKAFAKKLQLWSKKASDISED